MRAAIFDMDGTILDSMHIWEEVSVGFLRQRGIEPAPTFKEDVRMMTLSESARFVQEVYGITESETEIIEAVYDAVRHFYTYDAALKPGADHFLRKIADAGVPMCIATATDRPFVELALRRLGVYDLFCGILTCTEIGYGKSRPDIFLAAANKLGHAPADTFVFEDSYPALVTAKAAGFSPAGVADRMSMDRQEDIQRISCLYITDFDAACKDIEPML